MVRPLDLDVADEACSLRDVAFLDVGLLLRELARAAEGLVVPCLAVVGHHSSAGPDVACQPPDAAWQPPDVEEVAPWWLARRQDEEGRRPCSRDLVE